MPDALNPIRPITPVRGPQPFGPLLATDTCQTDPGLTAVVDAWNRLPEAVRAGIVATVKAASGK